ncbi:MAG: YegS/Rv2252/BmrU family lipid kinase [Desulfobacterales bacterium]|jgi:diacylglycerol kinase (ATP)|nr:YegS/Rv2252/BmrU family lipid kinase [Desulfobacterales bacterium]
MKTVALVNPAAGRGRAARKWPVLAASLGAGKAPAATWWTEGPRHAERLAAKARREGAQRLIVVGGDGTLLEAINGLWWEPSGALPSVGIVPVGTGCDYARNFSLGATLQDKLAAALAEPTVAVDVGLCRLIGPDGRPRARVFLNVLGFGFDAAVIGRVQRRPLKIRGRMAYLIASLREISQARCFSVAGTIDAEPVDTRALIVAAGLGTSFGAGMRITPAGNPTAGRFQVVWGENLSRLELLRLLPKIYAGGHLGHPKVRSRCACRVALAAQPAAGVEAEGELIGTTPVGLEIHPRRLRIACGGLVAPARAAATDGV